MVASHIKFNLKRLGLGERNENEHIKFYIKAFRFNHVSPHLKQFLMALSIWVIKGCKVLQKHFYFAEFQDDKTFRRISVSRFGR